MKPITNAIKEIGNKIIDFIFPRHCVACGRTNPTGEYEHICPDCVKTLRLLNGARCTICSEPIGPIGLPNIHGCPKCAERKFKFDKSLCLCTFDGVARDMVHELKYRTGAYIIHDMAKIAKKFPELNEFLKDAILVPIPLHNTRAISRKYNQSELIAKMLIQTFPNTNAKVKTILKRTRSTPTQTTLDRNARALNIKDAFALTKTKTTNTIKKDANIILVDDVMTSGATLSECAKILKKAAFKNVGAFTFSKRL